MAHQGYDIPNQQVEDKLRRVLFQFLNADFKINDDTCLEKLLTHLSHQGESAYLHSVCLEWMEQILQLEKPKPSVISFALRLVALVVDNEAGFQSLQAGNIVVRLCQLVQNGNLNNEIPVKVAYITLLSALTKHNPGCGLIIEFAWWQDVVRLCHESRSIYVTRDSRNFVTALLTRLEGRPDVCEQVLRLALGPLGDAPPPAPTLSLARHVLETCLVADCLAVARVLLGPTFDLGSRAAGWLERDAGCQEVAKLSVLVCFATFKRDRVGTGAGTPVTAADLKELERQVFRLFSLLIARKQFSTILKVSVYGHLTWKKIFTELQSSEESTYFFENQLMSLQLIPVLVNMATRAADNECLDVYCDKLFALTNEETQRVCYSFREHLLNMDNKQEMAHQAILSILQLEHVIQRDRAVVVFQALMYTLKDFVPDAQHAPPGAVGSDNVTRYPQLLGVVLQSLGSLIQCYSISWRESVETVCLFGYTQDLLKDPNLTPKLNVLALKLIQVAITKFMPPNLALLMDTLQGSTLNQIGPLLFRKLHDRYWEVRDSALEVLQVVASLANIKFPAFQEHVMEHNLCSLAVALACDDGESYVRASALKCVAQMVKVRAFWESCLSTQELPRKVMMILQKESEGVVRKEAAALMKEIYQHHNFPKAIMREVYQTMSNAVTKDLYWEVEVNALGFWERVIEQQMADQGMIDGVFPNVTFSREHRKIVTLTPHEIKSRLGKVLRELEQLGCLHVLLTALEDCDLKVVQKAASVLERLACVMTLYGVMPPPAATPHTTAPTNKPILDTFGFDNYETGGRGVPIPLESIAMDFDFKSPRESTECNGEDGGHPRADKRKLNGDSLAGSSESDELGFSDLVAREGDPPANNTVADRAPASNGSSKKPVKIFKIDNLNNTRDYDLACVPLEFKVDNNGETPRHKDEPFPAGFEPRPARTPKVDNAVANTDGRRPIDSEQVIDEIVKQTDMNLLATVYRTQMSISEGADPSGPARPSVGPEEFLSRLAGLGLDQILAERDRWMAHCGNDLDSLLDDILACNRGQECGALDCY